VELNPPGQPFRYSGEGARIVTTWDIADVTYQGLASAGTIDKDYALTVTLDEASGTSRIKQPLFGLLESAGWQPARKGFLARLFSR
jgi:hypothetical protein